MKILWGFTLCLFFSCSAYAEARKSDEQSMREFASQGDRWAIENLCESRIPDWLDYCVQASKLGDESASLKIYIEYEYGYHVPQDRNKALEWLRIMADQGLSGGWLGLGKRYLYGLGVPQDDKEALRHFKKTADSAAFDAGYLYETGRGTKRDYDKAVSYYRKYINSRESWPWEGQYRLGMLTYQGLGISKDEKAARSFLWQAFGALVGQSPFIGAAIDQSVGTVRASQSKPPRDIELANLEKIKVLAEKGDADAEYALGMAYAIAGGVDLNDSEAVTWWRKAALDGHTGAMYNVGVSYLRGMYMGGVESDPQEALYWLKKAEEAGDVRATYIIGWLAFRGIKSKADIGLPKRPRLFGPHYDSLPAPARTEARVGLERIKKAADAGLAEAQAMLAVVYALGLDTLGLDTPPDIQLSQTWWERYQNTIRELFIQGVPEYVNPASVSGQH